METHANHLLIGVFTVALAALALLFGLWASKYTLDTAWTDYEVRFSEAVTGLNVGGSVRYNGIPVGTIRELSLDPDDPRQVIAVIRVDAGTPIKQDTIARLGLTGLTGVAFIQLTGGSPESPPLEPPAPRELARIEADDSALQKLMSASEDIAGQVGEALNRALNLLTEENAENISRTLANIDQLTGVVLDERDAITAAIRDAGQATEQLAALMTRADGTLARFDASMVRVDEALLADLPELGEELRVAVHNLSLAAARADGILAENEDALAAFGTEGLSQLGPSLQELRLLIRDVSRLSGRFERNPTRFLLGGEQLEEYHPQ